MLMDNVIITSFYVERLFRDFGSLFKEKIIILRLIILSY